MRYALSRNIKLMFILALPFILNACSSMSTSMNDSDYNGGGNQGVVDGKVYTMYNPNVDYAQRMPAHIATREKTVVVNPAAHAWGAYDQQGNLVHGGIVTAGGNYCPDVGRPCRTNVGSFRVYSVGSPDCVSKVYPKPKGGGLMPYCMFFSGGQALHGSLDNALVEGNVSHGCVRMSIPDAEWLRYNFVNVGTKVIVQPYSG